MASSHFLDIRSWINNLPPITLWTTNTESLCICSGGSTSPSMNLLITKIPRNQIVRVIFSIYVEFRIPISLWSSNSFDFKSDARQNLDEIGIDLFLNLVNGVLKYDACKKESSPRFSKLKEEEFANIFNLAFLTLNFLVCIYEAPQDIRRGCLDALRLQLMAPRAREASKLLMKALGSNLEEKWMRTLNLAITNQMVELRDSKHSFKTPSPLFSYALSTIGLWKVQCYCPVIAMKMENISSRVADERLSFSLNNQQLEAVIQLAYRVNYSKNWMDVLVTIDNIRCDVNPLVPQTLLNERGYGCEEKHFPSRISLQLTPTLQNEILSVSVTKSSENQTREVEIEKSLEASFDPPNSYMSITASASESVTISIKPWKFEQSVFGSTANFNWFLHDGVNGREVSSSKPSKLALLQPKAWFRDRYSSAYRPFTKQGGVIFARDEYGEGLRWRICQSEIGKNMEFEIIGQIWLTYWPNKQRTFHSETKKLEFKELLYLSLAEA
ncbi:uncharacterized protein LOC110035877 [Phalaenopsis equestris]|uniref:uncharacterized protein LOC110035877 n=1 Tax=Phalaenopsis equestris TaxID=78828 RepID=UPI0009E56BF7|nr:uncharacterized protein LOC110035877 [Phalaenopsis equestris]